MMRPLLSFVLCGAIAAPGAAMAQAVPSPAQPAIPSEPPARPVLAPLPTVAPTEPAAPAVTAPPPPSVEPGAPAPELAPPTTVAPVIVAKDDKNNGVGGKVGTVAVGVAGGAAGAAVAGPVGKFAGGFLAKQVAQGIFGAKKDKTPELTVIPQTPSAVAAGTSAIDPAAPPPKATVVADER